MNFTTSNNPVNSTSEDTTTVDIPSGTDFNNSNFNYSHKSKEPSTIGVFTIMQGNEWLRQANKRPIPNPLFLCLWYEGEVCILFADTNLGKSILAVQVAIEIAARHKVIYFDFELSDKQFEYRYSNDYTNHYQFPDNFYRAEINPDEADYTTAGFASIEDYLNYSIEQSIKETGATVLIIDNLTYLRNETEKAKDALPLMKHLKALKRKHNLSILALAHTPKRDLSKPITRNDLQGSKMLMNFCDSSFAIGESTKDKSIRYIKQIKERHTEKVYDSENVIEYRITKEDNFLHFEPLGHSSESEHLRVISEMEKTELEKEIRELLQADPTLTAYAIAKKLCTDESKFNSFKVKVNRIVHKINISNR